MPFDLSVRGLLPVVLFVVLSPGLLLTIPGSGTGLGALKPDFASGKTTVMAILVHAVVFFVALSLLKSVV